MTITRSWDRPMFCKHCGSRADYECDCPDYHEGEDHGEQGRREKADHPKFLCEECFHKMGGEVDD